MSKRYYICDVIGDGTDGNEYRPSVADIQGVNWVGSIPGDAQGRPLFPWALVLVATNNHAQLRDVAGIDPLPDFPLDGRMNAVNNAAGNAMSAALSRRGVSVSWGGTDGYRDVVRAIGRRLDAAFDENKFDVAE